MSSRLEALQVLELPISKPADAEDVKRAYRDMAKKWHPDVNPSEEAQERFGEAKAAFDFLERNPGAGAKPVLGPRAEHGDSLFAQKAEALGLRRGVLLMSPAEERRKQVAVVLRLGPPQERAVLLNMRSGAGGSHNNWQQTMLHRCPDLSVQGLLRSGPITNEDVPGRGGAVFAECGLKANQVTDLSQQLRKLGAGHHTVRGHMAWGEWELQEEVQKGVWAIHPGGTEFFDFWFREGHKFSSDELWQHLQE